MRDNKFVTRLASGTLVSAVAGAVLLAGGVANAAPLPTSVGITTVQAADPVTTTTTLAVTPASPADGNSTETLTATLDPATAAGAVEFNDGSNPLGAAVTVANGTASTTATLPTGEHSLTAVFTPTDTTTSGSTSNTVDYTVNGAPAGATVTTTTLDVTPASPADGNSTETLTATLDPSTAAGAVVFNDGTNPLGAAVTVANGTASTTATLPTGEHSLTAVFTPTDTTTSGSSSNTVDYTVNGNRGDRHATRNIRGILGHDRGVLGGHRNNRTNVNNNRGNVGNLGNLGGIQQGILGGIQGVLGDLGGNVSN